MAYYMSMATSSFNVLSENVPKALELLKKLAKENNELCISMEEYASIFNAKSLSEALDIFYYQLNEDEKGNIIGIEFTGEKNYDDYRVFCAIAPAVENESFIEMSGEDWSSWRWVFMDGSCERIEPTIIWKNDKKNTNGELNMYAFGGTEYPILDTPLIRTQIIREMNNNGCVKGVVAVPFSSVLDADYADFLDLISDKLIGNNCLSNVQYKIVGCGSSDVLLVLVSGDVDGIEIEDIPDNIEINLPDKFHFKSRMNAFAGNILYHAEKFNGYGDYRITWKCRNESELSEINSTIEYYTEKETKYFINTKRWTMEEILNDNDKETVISK